MDTFKKIQLSRYSTDPGMLLMTMGHTHVTVEAVKIFGITYISTYDWHIQKAPLKRFND